MSIKDIIDEMELTFYKKTGRTCTIIVGESLKNREKLLSLQELLEIVDSVLSEYSKEKTILYFSRKKHLVDVRHIYTHVAHIIGYSSVQISRILKKDRTVITDYINNFHYRMTKRGEEMKEPFIEVIKKVKIKINNIDEIISEAKTTFFNT